MANGIGTFNNMLAPFLNQNVKSMKPDGTIDLHDDTEILSSIIQAGSPFASGGQPAQGLAAGGPQVGGGQDDKGFLGGILNDPGFYNILGQLGTAIAGPNTPQGRVGQVASNALQNRLFNQLVQDLLGGQNGDQQSPLG